MSVLKKTEEQLGINITFSVETEPLGTGTSSRSVSHVPQQLHMGADVEAGRSWRVEGSRSGKNGSLGADSIQLVLLPSLARFSARTTLPSLS